MIQYPLDACLLCFLGSIQDRNFRVSIQTIRLDVYLSVYWSLFLPRLFLMGRHIGINLNRIRCVEWPVSAVSELHSQQFQWPESGGNVAAAVSVMVMAAIELRSACWRARLRTLSTVICVNIESSCRHAKLLPKFRAGTALLITALWEPALVTSAQWRTPDTRVTFACIYCRPILFFCGTERWFLSSVFMR